MDVQTVVDFTCFIRTRARVFPSAMRNHPYSEQTLTHCILYFEKVTVLLLNIKYD